MSQPIWEVVTDHHCLLGEGPVWDPTQKRILWTDILKSEIQCFYPDRDEHRTYKVGQMVGAMVLRTPGGLMGAVKEGFAEIDLEKGTTRLVSEVESHLPGNRFNDGKCDPAGRFWAGTMSMSDTPHAGSLYAMEKDLTVSTKITGVTCSNGLAWSSDLTTLYYIDTPTSCVKAYRYEVATGNISGGGVVIDIPKEEGYPDGMTIDTEGKLWVALWDGWKVARYDPHTGKQLQEIGLPVSRPTCCVFGGDTMEDIYITSAREGLSDRDVQQQPLAGCLFVVKNSGFKGKEAFAFPQ